MFRVWLGLVLLWLVVLGRVLLLGLGLRLVLIRPVLLVLLWGVVCWVGCCLGFRWRGL